MSQLEELIRTLHPNGVEYFAIKDCCVLRRGDSITRNSTKEGPIPVIAGGQRPAYFADKANRTGETIVVSSSGAYAGYVSYWNTPIFVSDAFSIEAKKGICLKFIFHFLKNRQEIIHSLKKGGGVPHVHVSDLAPMIIPIPPLPIQQEIVRILDTFSGVVAELEQSLEAEQAARVRQYEHYRDSLLFFEDGVNRKRLGEIGNFYGGLTGKTKNDFQNGNHKFITYMNVYKNPAVDTRINDYVKINTNERQNTVQYGDILFTGSSETPEECGISSVMVKHPDEPFYLNSFTIGFRLHDSGMLNPEFSKHLFRSSDLRKQINKTANGVTRFNVSKAKLSEVIVPIPTLIAQEKIVSILDRFDTLVNDLKSGLPAEIALRRKQYEYYRDKLLTFQPLE